jgi:hypothetical protein
MRSIWSFFFALTVSTVSALPSLADGLLIGPSGNLLEQHIDLTLTVEQAKSIKTKDTIVLTESQRKYLTAWHPKAANVSSLFLEREPEANCTCESVNIAVLASPTVIEIPIRLLGRNIQAEIEEDRKWERRREAERKSCIYEQMAVVRGVAETLWLLFGPSVCPLGFCRLALFVLVIATPVWILASISKTNQKRARRGK